MKPLPAGIRRLVIVAAVARGGVIGWRGRLPWHLPEDLRHFRRVTQGHAVIMGRRTFESIGRPLPRRHNIVLTRRRGWKPEGVHVARCWPEALQLAARLGDEAPRVIGGASVYALALPQATDLVLTEVDFEVPGDTFFPAFDREAFERVESRESTTTGVRFVHLRRRDPPHRVA